MRPLCREREIVRRTEAAHPCLLYPRSDPRAQRETLIRDITTPQFAVLVNFTSVRP